MFIKLPVLNPAACQGLNILLLGHLKVYIDKLNYSACSQKSARNCPGYDPALLEIPPKNRTKSHPRTMLTSQASVFHFERLKQVIFHISPSPDIHQAIFTVAVNIVLHEVWST